MYYFSRKILAWYEKHGRFDLPWKKNMTPYRVWISEIMLQQTQVTRVPLFYESFMQRFPNIYALQKSNIDQVLNAWSGLGYYTRARNIHRASKILYKKYNCIFPQNIEDIESLPGIGRSTAGAIMSFSMNIRKSILDANVKRVLTRYYGITSSIYKRETNSLLWEIADKNTPQENVANYNQAIMDFGSKICKNKTPFCNSCPLSERCIARIESIQKQIPNRKKTAANKLNKKVSVLLLMRSDKHLLLEKKEKAKTLNGLWRLPEFNIDKSIEFLYNKVYDERYCFLRKLKKVKYSFSHINFDVYPVIIKLGKRRIITNFSTKTLWYKVEKELSGGISTYTKKVINYWRKHDKDGIL